MGRTKWQSVILAVTFAIGSLVGEGTAVHAAQLGWDPTAAKYAATPAQTVSFGNADCTANTTPYSCCTGTGTGTCTPVNGIKFANGSTTVAYLPFPFYPPDAATSGTPFAQNLTYHTSATSGTVCWRMSMAIQLLGAGGSVTFNTLTYGTAISGASTVSGTANVGKIATGGTLTTMGPASFPSGIGFDPIIVKLERVSGLGGCTDNAGQDVFVDSFSLSY